MAFTIVALSNQCRTAFWIQCWFLFDLLFSRLVYGHAPSRPPPHQGPMFRLTEFIRKWLNMRWWKESYFMKSWTLFPPWYGWLRETVQPCIVSDGHALWRLSYKNKQTNKESNSFADFQNTCMVSLLLLCKYCVIECHYNLGQSHCNLSISTSM